MSVQSVVSDTKSPSAGTGPPEVVHRLSPRDLLDAPPDASALDGPLSTEGKDFLSETIPAIPAGSVSPASVEGLQTPKHSVFRRSFHA